ncbi:MAG: hypothetical protein OHK0023_15530 [Anaerolineae bacterium]
MTDKSDESTRRATQTAEGTSAAFSLMYPHGSVPQISRSTAWANDLGLDMLANAISIEHRYSSYIRQTLAGLNSDPSVIAWRQAVLNDFLDIPMLLEGVAKLLPNLAELRQGRTLLGNRQRPPLLETADRLTELEVYLNTVSALYELLRTAPLRAQALVALREQLRRLSAEAEFQKLKAELPELQRPLQKLSSLTIGVNLDAQLQPLSAVLLSINEYRFGEPRSLLSRLIGHPGDVNDSAIAPVHHTPDDPSRRPLSPLYQDLERLLSQTLQPVARALARYVRISAAPLTGLEQELAFYVSAAQFIQKMAARNVPFCQVQIAPNDERAMHIEGLVNIHLALRANTPLIPNEARFDADGRIAILTGPNSGGKTTYLQAIGLAQVLFQAGLHVPSQSARISPVDGIFTHFPALESQQSGRLAEEAARLREICLRATDKSLVLLNESLSSTIASEALYLAQDVLCGLRAIGVRAIFATHLVELAERVAEMHGMVEGSSDLYSLTAGVALREDGSAQPTFQITRGAPLGRGYAREIARRHGISLEQILQARSKNGSQATNEG